MSGLPAGGAENAGTGGCQFEATRRVFPHLVQKSAAPLETNEHREQTRVSDGRALATSSLACVGVPHEVQNLSDGPTVRPHSVHTPVAGEPKAFGAAAVANAHVWRTQPPASSKQSAW